MKLKKEEAAALIEATRVINKLFGIRVHEGQRSRLCSLVSLAYIRLAYHHIGDESTSFGQGWNDSRRSLIMLCNLNKYWDNE